MYADREGNVWTGLHSEGPDHFNPRPLPFEQFGHDPGNPQALDIDFVHDIYEDHEGLLWIGNDNAMVRVDRKTPLLLRALGQRIRELRTEQAFSQEGFADKCGVHRTLMGTVEGGESNLSFQNIAKVATTLGVPLSTLFRDLEGKAQILAAQSAGTAAIKPKKHRTASTRHP